MRALVSLLLTALVMTHRAWALALFGFVIACDAGEAPEVELTTSSLTRSSDFLSLTGTKTTLVSAYVFDEQMFFRTNYMLDDKLQPTWGIGPNGSSILGSSLGVTLVDGRSLAGRRVIGTELMSVDVDGALQMVRIDDVRRSESGDQDLLHYEVSVKDGSTWQPLCGDQPAIALPGTWDLQPGARGAAGWRDETGFFFACADSSVAKCYEMGFKPWKFQMEGDTVLNLHEACVRALRADFGGTGAAGTTNGVEVVLSTDRQAQTPPGFVLEAAWSVDGARCRLRERVEGMNPDLQAVPLCDEARLEDARNLLYSFTREATPDVDPDLKFALSCDDPGGSDLVDERGGRTGAVRGQVTRTGDTPDGSAGACHFGGWDPGATFSSIDVGATITISAWVRPESFEGNARGEARIVSKASSTAASHHDWMLGFKSGQLRARVRTTGRTLTVLSHGRLSLGAWHHVALTYDGAFVRMYIDGALDREVARTGSLSNRMLNVGVGNQPAGTGERGLEGAIDGLRLYGRALTPIEIARQAIDERTR